MMKQNNLISGKWTFVFLVFLLAVFLIPATGIAGSRTRLTNNSYDDNSQQINNNGYVVWRGQWDGAGGGEQPVCGVDGELGAGVYAGRGDARNRNAVCGEGVGGWTADGCGGGDGVCIG